jgi:hypothetical protein
MSIFLCFQNFKYEQYCIWGNFSESVGSIAEQHSRRPLQSPGKFRFHASLPFQACFELGMDVSTGARNALVVRIQTLEASLQLDSINM